MTASHVSGPIVVYGAPAGATATNTNPEAGPSVFYGGSALFDPRFPYGPGGGPSILASGLRGPPLVRGFLGSGSTCIVDAIPATKATVGTVTIGQTVGALTTTNATWGIAGSMKLIPANTAYTAANQQTVCGLDLGFGSCTTAGTTAVTSYVGNDGLGTASLYVGQPIVISGGTSTTAPFFTYITAIGSATAFTIASAAPASASNLAVGSAHPSLLSPDPYLVMGGAYVLDPRQALSRTLAYTSSSAGDTTQTCTAAGYDIYGVPMTETASLNGTSVIAGTKAFKYVKSLTLSATAAGTVTVTSGNGGTGGDIIGLNLRSTFFEQMELFYNAAALTATTGYVAAVTTSPATAITGDVRGTYALQAAANGSAPATGKRFTAYINIRPVDLQLATAANTVPLFGVTQF